MTSLYDTYRSIYSYVAQNGEDIESRYGDTKETLGLSVSCETIEFPARTGMNLALGFMEACQVLAGTYDLDALKRAAPKANHILFTEGMAYGPKISNQIPKVIHLLLNQPLSRQAVLYLGNAEVTCTNDLPCTETIQFLIRNGYLQTIVTMRSWDLTTGLPYDLMTFSLISQVIAHCLNVKVGETVVNAGSAHIYLKDIEKGKLPKNYSYEVHINSDLVPTRGIVGWYYWVDIAYKAINDPWSECGCGKSHPDYITLATRTAYVENKN